jgi:hypothetical protein
MRRLLFSIFAILFIALRVYCAAAYRVDSDEPQHLHIVWGVTHGLVQYRDVFDNHSPLFHLLYAPLFLALGERADIVETMRMGMVPLYFGVIACVYLICTRLFSRRCGVLAALFTAFYPRFFCTSIEFRPDNLWALTWLLLLTVLVCVRRPAIRWLLSGLLLGIGFSISMKTTVMALDLGAAGVLTWMLCKRGPISFSQLTKSAALFVIGLTMVPCVLLLRFAANGALANLYYCLIQHNLIAASERAHYFDFRGFAVLAALAGILWWSRRIIRFGEDRPLAMRRVFILLVGGIYPVILFIFWPLVTREDFLALMPVVGMVATPALLVALEKLRQYRPRFAPFEVAIPACLILALLAIDIHIVQPWHDRADFEEGILANTLKLTDPGDYIMDTKGEMIYRNRPYYYALEEMTRWMFKSERIADDIPEQMIAHGVCVAARNGERYPGRTAKFLKENFVPVSFRVLVAGKILTPAPAGNPTSFQIDIPAKYALRGVMESGTFLLDGKAYEGPVALAPGQHSLQTVTGTGPVAIVWAQAIERGYNPFYQLSAAEIGENSQAKQDNIF